MIRPSTRVFGVVMVDPRADGLVVRLYNALLGFNQLDGAYLSFLATAGRLTFMLDGFSVNRTAEQLDVVPEFQAAAGRWVKAPGPVDVLKFGEGGGGWLREPDAGAWREAERVCARAVADVRAWFGVEPRVPEDWAEAVGESGLRACVINRELGELP